MLARLSAMMMLQSWPLGAWGVTVATYITTNTGQSGEGIFSPGFAGFSTAAGALGGLIAPTLIGLVSDRRISSQLLLALMNLGCAGAALGMCLARDQPVFLVSLLAFFHCYLSAVTLTNKIAFGHLSDPATGFPFIRLFGALGWISSGLFIGLLWPAMSGSSIEAARTPFMIACVASLLMSVYALTLPATPPATSKSPGDATRQARWVLLANRPLVAFLVLSLLACIPSMAYNNFSNPFLNWEGYPHPAALLTLGQASEIACLAAMALLLRRVSLRLLFGLGVLAWAARYVLLAVGAAYGLGGAVLLAILLHGPCFAFVYVAGPMYTDNLVEARHRGAAQGLYTGATMGLANLAGAVLVGCLQRTFLTPPDVTPPPYNWEAFWIVPAVLSLLTALAWIVLLKRFRSSEVV